MSSRQLRAIQPLPIPPRDSESEQSGKRGKNNQACNECRRSRTKCDGGRPVCATCVSKKRRCRYVGNQGETRITANKHRLELLERVFNTLRSGPSDQAVEVLDAIRSSDDLSSILTRLAVDGPDHQTLSTSSPAGSLQIDTPVSEPDKAAVSPALLCTNSSPSLTAVSDIQPSVPSPSDGVASRPHPASLGETNVSVLASSGAYRITLPDPKEVDRAIRGFFKCSGRLFHVFSKPQISEFFHSVYNRSDDPLNASDSTLCCLMSVAAIGAQYEHGTYELKTEAAFYNIARHYFDDIVQSQGLDAIKVCALLALYNILAKATVALSYVEIGLSLSRQFSITNPEQKYSELSPATFTESKHAWRTLTFMSNWLSSTLGYVSGNDIMPYETLPLGLASSSADIIENLTLLSVKFILEDLQAWYGRMPPQIRLDYPGRDTFAPLTKWSIYHVHLLYLGANILLYQRMLSQHVETYYVNRDRSGLYQSMEKLFSDQGEQAILAAKGSARILSLLLRDCGVFKRCWLVIFQSYTSCSIILHSAIQKLSHGWKASTWQDDLQKAGLCLTVLEYCMSSDSTALGFYKELKDVYDYIDKQPQDCPLGTQDPSFQQPLSEASTVDDTIDGQPFRTDIGSLQNDSSYLITIPPNAEPEHKERSYRILVKLCQPFGDPNHQGLDISDVKQQRRDEPTRGLHTLMMAKLDWDLEARQPFHMGLGKASRYSTSLNSSELPPSVMAKPDQVTLPGPGNNFSSRFLGSMEPLGWARLEGISYVGNVTVKQTDIAIDRMVVD
ncbi:hypothetical protein BKA67DRAFT_529380 [Truncatella angustata]|uniref:Zn(2)-C6 fungal-type domain-containing protein n=1 Tax=Truncatella angustata TaxID=152316 RepID=A0A9P9A2A7_9PEZI|nr:uncharacterized protein BKA67DRAFT_529380 [Truncatella angustata]KAH6659207.1 hypothetical protein BKA67DRAFT_529380 [Truncatella angustata]